MESNGRSAYRVVIIGGGIAGASLAYFLAQRGVGDVLLIEREAGLAYHASGRSAETVVELDHNPVVRRLKVLGARFLREPPAGFAENPLLDPIGVMALYHGDAAQRMRQRLGDLRREGLRCEWLGAAAVVDRVAVLQAQAFDGAVWLPADGRLDAHELLSGYLRAARAAGVEVCCEREAVRIGVQQGRVTSVETSRGRVGAQWVVNAAGAWASSVAALAGAAAVPLVPLRRSATLMPTPASLDVRRWPLVLDDELRFYFRPDRAGLLFCPMDEHPSEPCDAAPDAEAIAAGIERLGAGAPALVPPSLGKSWGGLRTFSPDRVPVVGPDPRVDGFFWFAGQGGHGLETSPSLGAIGADLLLDGRTERFDAALLSAERF